MPSSPSFATPPTDYKTRAKPEQQEQQTDERTATRATAPAPAAAASFAARKQWDAKARSFQRGLEHVRQCRAGDACGSSLCHSTRRLMRTYASHPCNKTAKSDCRVCKLWHFLMAQCKDQEPEPQQPSLQRALAQQGATSCGWSWAAHSRRLNARSSASLHRRIAASHKTAQSLTRRF